MLTYSFSSYIQDTMTHHVSIKSKVPNQQVFDDLAKSLNVLPNSGYSYGDYGMHCYVADSDLNMFKNILVEKDIVE